MRWMLAVLVAACANTGPLIPSTMDEATFDRELAARFQYGPPQPGPGEIADRSAGQAADAAYFARFPEFDRAYRPAARIEAQLLLTRLQTEAASLSHEQFVLRVAEIAALADNGHTSIGRNAFMKNTTRIPVRTYLFEDGLHVLYADAANTDLLGARIDTIDGRSIEEIYRVIRRYRGGSNEFRQRQLIPMLESPALLAAAGVANAADALTLSGALANGAPFQRRVQAEQRDRGAWVSSTQRLTYPGQLDDVGMHSFLRASAELPTYLHGADNLFWMETAPSDGLYVRIEHNADADEGPIEAFLESVLARVRNDHPAFVVLDMRNNGGGDYTTTYAFAQALPEAAATAPIYVVTSPWTFSAAITTVAALKDAGGDQVTIVGEHVGDRLDFWAEGSAFELPNAFVLVNYATARHNYAGPCRDRATCFWLNERYPVRVRTLEPDIAAPLTFAAYRALRDPAMDAVLARETRRRSSARTH